MERLKILIFRIRNRQFALVSKNVKEIVDSCVGVKPVFYGGKTLKGLMSFGSDLVSVIDTPLVLGIEGEEQDPMILICMEKGIDRPVGITVSAVKGMDVISMSRVTPSQESDAGYIAGFIKEEENGEVVTLLDLRRFLDYAETKIEKM